MTALMLSKDRSELIVFWLPNEMAPTPPHENSGSGGPSHLARSENKQHVAYVHLTQDPPSVALKRQGGKMAPRLARLARRQRCQ
jgi:hypothetical protein